MERTPVREARTPGGVARTTERFSASLTLFLSMFAAQAALLVLSPILPNIAREFGVSTAAAGQLRSVSGLAAGVGALLVGRLAGRMGLRDLIGAGLALLALACIASAAAPSFAVLATAQVALGCGIAVVVSAASAAPAEWTPERRNTVLSWTLLGQPAAWIVGMPIVGLLTVMNWRFAWLAVPTLATLLAVGVLLRRPRDAGRCGSPAAMRRALRRPGVARWALGELLALSAWAGTLVFCGALFVESFDASPGLTGFLLAGVAVAYVPGNFLAGRLVDGKSAVPLTVLAVASSGAVLAFGCVRPSLLVSELALCALGFLNGARTFAGSRRGLELAGGDRLALMSVRTAALQFGYLLGAVVGGGAVAIGGYPALGSAFAVLFVAAAVTQVAPVPSRAR